MKLHRLPVAVAIAALFAGAVAVRGYVILRPELRWQDGPIQVHEQITGGTAGPLLDGSASLNVAFENALQTWNQYLGRIQFVPVRDSTVTVGDGDDVSNVFRAGDVYGKPFDSDVFVLTKRWYDTVTNRRTEFDTIFNGAYNWNAYRGPQRSGVMDLTRVALRQLGFALGLSAPAANGQPGVEALMNLGISDRDALTLDDISGARSLYGSAEASPPPSSASQVKQFKTQTDATGVATFVPTGGRAVSVRFVDEDTRAGIPAADAYLFADPNGIATVALYDPFGRYFTRMAPMRLPQSVATADPPRGVRPIDVPVPSVTSSPQGTASVLMDRLPSGMAAAMAPVMQRARDLLDAAVANKIIVDKEITLAELTEPSIKSYIQDNVRDNVADNTFEYVVDKSGLGAKDRIITWFTRLGVATTVRDAVWDLSRVGFSEMGYADDQKFRVKILQAPVPLPSFIRKYTEWKIYVTPIEAARRSDPCDYYGLLCQGGGRHQRPDGRRDERPAAIGSDHGDGFRGLPASPRRERPLRQRTDKIRPVSDLRRR